MLSNTIMGNYLESPPGAAPTEAGVALVLSIDQDPLIREPKQKMTPAWVRVFAASYIDIVDEASPLPDQDSTDPGENDQPKARAKSGSLFEKSTAAREKNEGDLSSEIFFCEYKLDYFPVQQEDLILPDVSDYQSDTRVPILQRLSHGVQIHHPYNPWSIKGITDYGDIGTIYLIPQRTSSDEYPWPIQENAQATLVDQNQEPVPSEKDNDLVLEFCLDTAPSSFLSWRKQQEQSLVNLVRNDIRDGITRLTRKVTEIRDSWKQKIESLISQPRSTVVEDRAFAN